MKISALHVRDDIAYAEVVGKSISLHFLRKDLRRNTELIDSFKFIVPKPVARRKSRREREVTFESSSRIFVSFVF